MENCCNITDFALGFQNPVCFFLPSFYKHHPGFYIILDYYCALIIYNKDGLKKLHTYFYMTCFLCFKKEFKKIIIKLNYLDLHHQNERHLRGDTKNHEQINRLYREGMHRTSTGLSFFYLTIFFLFPITPTTCLRSEIVTERILNITRNLFL